MPHGMVDPSKTWRKAEIDRKFFLKCSIVLFLRTTENVFHMRSEGLD